MAQAVNNNLKESIESKNFLYEKQNGICIGCTEHFKLRNLTLDHIIPTSKNGSEHITNLQLLCHMCNSVKHDRILTTDELRKIINRTPEQIRKDHLASKIAIARNSKKRYQKIQADPILREKRKASEQKRYQKIKADTILRERHTERNVVDIIKDGEYKFGKSTFKAAIKLKLFESGLNTYAKQYTQAKKWADTQLYYNLINTEDIMAYYKLKITKTRVDKQHSNKKNI